MKNDEKYKIIVCRICNKTKMKVAMDVKSGICWKCCMKKTKLKKAFQDKVKEKHPVVWIVF